MTVNYFTKMKTHWIIKMLYRKIRLWKKMMLIFILLFIIINISLHYDIKKSIDIPLSENVRLKIILDQKIHEVLRLKAVLRKFKVPKFIYEASDQPVIFVITPTYSRLVQKAELTRLKNVFIYIPNLYWIVVEDAVEKSQLVSNFLKSSGINYDHLAKRTPSQHQLKPNLPKYRKPRGVYQRNEGIIWLRTNYLDANGIVYFADDDNTYSIELFDEIKKTKNVGIWPVGLVGGVKVEHPIVKNKKVIGWNVGWRTDRKFATDMAGFSVNLGLLLKKNVLFNSSSKIGFMETDFLSQLISPNQLEPLAEDCSKVLVWHTQTKDPVLNKEREIIRYNKIEV